MIKQNGGKNVTMNGWLPLIQGDPTSHQACRIGYSLPPPPQRKSDEKLDGWEQNLNISTFSAGFFSQSSQKKAA